MRVNNGGTDDFQEIPIGGDPRRIMRRVSAGPMESGSRGYVGDEIFTQVLGAALDDAGGERHDEFL